MENERKTDAAPVGGRYYPRKMRKGWCVAHLVTVMGATIERFGVKYGTYPEAFKAAQDINKAEAAATAPERLPDVRKEVQV